MEQYSVKGMHCAACSARVEKAVSKVEGVSSCSVNLLTNSMGVEGTASSESIIKAVVDAGYKAKLMQPRKDKGAGAAADEGSVKGGLYAAEEEAHTRGLVHEEQGYAGQNNAAGDDKVLFRMDLLEIVFHFF